MFHDMPAGMRERMLEMEARDTRERREGVPKALRLRQIVPETGRLLALLAAGAPPGARVEVGTSGGYSTLWLALGSRAAGGTVVSFEVDPAKVALARETFRAAGVEALVEVRQQDARAGLAALERIAFCFIDAEKEIYGECIELVIPRLIPGGLLAADNAISHQDELHAVIERTLADPRLDALVVPIGKGVLLARKA